MSKPLPEPERMAQARNYLREALRASGVTMRQLSLSMQKDPSYVGQLLETTPDRPRALPTPDELRKAAPVLKVPFRELLYHIWDIKSDDLSVAPGGIPDHRDTTFRDLSGAEWRELLSFAHYLHHRRTIEHGQSE